MTLYLRQKNEALDEDQKVLRQQLGLYKKQIQLWDQSGPEDQGPGILTLDNADYFKLKIQIANFSDAANKVALGLNRDDFAAIGGLQKAYENLARFVRDVLQGNYLTADKTRVVQMINPALIPLRKLSAMAAEDRFEATEKLVVNTILNNITEKTFEPLGFLPVADAPQREAEKTRKRQQKEKEMVANTDPESVKLREKIVRLITEITATEGVDETYLSADGENLLKEAKGLVSRLTREPEITRRVFNNINDKYLGILEQFPDARAKIARTRQATPGPAGPPPPPPSPPPPPPLKPAPKTAAAADTFVDEGSSMYQTLVRNLRVLGDDVELRPLAENQLRRLVQKTKDGQISLKDFRKVEKSYEDLANPLSPRMTRGRVP